MKKRDDDHCNLSDTHHDLCGIICALNEAEHIEWPPNIMQIQFARHLRSKKKNPQNSFELFDEICEGKKNKRFEYVSSDLHHVALCFTSKF